MTSCDVLIPQADLARRVDQLASEIITGWHGESPKRILMVPMLKGAFVFAADLMRALCDKGAEVRVEFLSISSYGGATRTSGDIQLRAPVPEVVKGKHVLLVDDIYDTGHSLKFAKSLMELEEAADVRICVLLRKPSRHQVELEVNHVGFEVPNKFVVGYGLDHAERYRELPYIGVIDDGDTP